MLQFTPQQRLQLAVAPMDFRKGINTIAALISNELLEEPDDGTLFVFTNRGCTAVKILVYDGQGYWLCMKIFSSGKLKWWPSESVQFKCQRSTTSVSVISKSRTVNCTATLRTGDNESLDSAYALCIAAAKSAGLIVPSACDPSLSIN